MFHEIDVRPHRSAFDVLLPEDYKIFAFCEDDDREELMLMILQAA